jgi:hypothetical protein
VSDVCFEAAFSLADRVFALRQAEDLIAFYDHIDNSQLCRHPVTRYPFDFSNGRILVGLWSKGRGCRARHDLVGVTRDDASRGFALNLLLVIEGDCNYELLRPFWVGLEGLTEYSIQINILP